MKRIFVTLYSRTATGAVQQWTITVEDNTYYVIAGQKDGQLVTSRPTICKGKNIGRANETSPERQALNEAQSKWDKKAKTGYTTNIDEIDTCTSYVEAMLAKNLDDYIDKIDFSQGVLVQNKYNGVRCIATKEAAKVLLKSRKGELWVSVVHINKDLEPFFAKFPDAVLDGELYNYDLRQHLNELIHLVRQTKDITAEDLAASEKMVRFYIYDGYGFDGLTETDSYLRRKAWIDKNLPKYSKYYREVPTKLVTSMAEVEKIYGEYLADGQEGAIIRLPGAPYEHKRSKFLLKYKPENDDEGEILDVEDGDGNYRDRAKTSWILWKGKKFKATWMGDEIQGRNILKNKKDWIGRTITFKYTHLTGKNGLPEYARIDPDNCFKGDR